MVDNRLSHFELHDDKTTPSLFSLQSTQKSILAEILIFCERQKIPCFLVAGSALGAVRHQDMIPWDDDIDLGMDRDSYRIFIEKLETHPIDGLHLQSIESEKAYPLSFAKIRKPGTEMKEEVSDALPVQCGVFIDVFPFDRVASSGLTKKFQMAMLFGLNLVIMSFSKEVCRSSSTGFGRVLRYGCYYLRGILPIRRLIGLREFLMASPKISREETLCCYEMYGIVNARKTQVSRDVLLPPQYTKFGDLRVPIPSNPHEYLEGIFGDYMQLPPVNERVPHHVKR